MTRPWLSVSLWSGVTVGEGLWVAAAIDNIKAIPFWRFCVLVRDLAEGPTHLLVQPGGSLAEHDPGDTEDQNDGHGDGHVKGDRVRPAQRIREILTHPKQQNGGDDRKLACNNQECVAQVAPVVQRLPLVGGQVALFKGKQGVCHRSLASSGGPSLRPPGPAAHTFDSITYRGACARGPAESKIWRSGGLQAG